MPEFNSPTSKTDLELLINDLLDRTIVYLQQTLKPYTLDAIVLSL